MRPYLQKIMIKIIKCLTCKTSDVKVILKFEYWARDPLVRKALAMRQTVSSETLVRSGHIFL